MRLEIKRSVENAYKLPRPLPGSATARCKAPALTLLLSGAGNIGDAGVKSPPTGRVDQDAIPTEAYRPSTEGDFHTGRGGLGNEHAAGKGGHKPLAESTSTSSGSTPISFADKIKNKLFGKK
jgi:hypothetical protein